MKIVVDTNIVFSAILNSKSRIAHILIGGKRHFRFYSCLFLLEELRLHRNKLCGLTKLSEAELEEVTRIVTKNITFIHENAVSPAVYKTTERLMKGNDLKDVPFVALAQEVKALLWTGDKVLSKGLAISHPGLVINTTDLFRHFNELEN